MAGTSTADHPAIESDRSDEIETFETVFAREHQPMLRVAVLLLGSQAMAEEAVQDAFARLLDRFDSVTNPGGYVRTATINRCRDLVRRREREKRLLRLFRRSTDDEPVTAAGPTTGELDDVLAALSARRREVIVLRYYLGHTNAEIAALLDMPETTVRTTVHRALNDLRDLLT